MPVLIPHGIKTEGTAPRWVLVRFDPPNAGETFEGQFRAESYSEDVSTNWAELVIGQRTEPAIQWTHGDGDGCRFRATFYAGTAVDSIEDKIDALKAAIRPDASLKRPPRFLFAWGRQTRVVVIRSLGGIAYEDLWSSGRAKRVTFDVDLRIVRDSLELEPTDPSKPPHKSRWRPVARGETFESIAATTYGDPMFGVLLRQDSAVAFPRPGERFRLPNARNFAGQAFSPRAYALGDSEAARAALSALFDDRARGGEIPAVITG